MEKPLRELNDFHLKQLEESNQISYFNYLPGKIDFSKIPKEHLSEVSKGDSHAIVGDHLYVKDFGFGRRYILAQKNFLSSKNSNTLESGLNKKT